MKREGAAKGTPLLGDQDDIFGPSEFWVIAFLFSISAHHSSLWCFTLIVSDCKNI